MSNKLNHEKLNKKRKNNSVKYKRMYNKDLFITKFDDLKKYKLIDWAKKPIRKEVVVKKDKEWVRLFRLVKNTYYNYYCDPQLITWCETNLE